MIVLLAYIMLGLVFGSFASMASWRLVQGESLLGRSRCSHCNNVLAPRSLIPILSYIIQYGKCLHCKAVISWRYPAIEIATMLAFIGIWWSSVPLYHALCLILATALLMIMIVTDFEELIIPDAVQIALAVVGFVYAFLAHRAIFDVLGTALIAWLIGLTLFYGSRVVLKADGLGWGDVKFFAVAGLFLTIENLSTFFFLSGIIGIVTAAVWQRLGRGREFPFAPALAISLYLCLVFRSLSKITAFI